MGTVEARIRKINEEGAGSNGRIRQNFSQKKAWKREEEPSETGC